MKQPCGRLSLEESKAIAYWNDPVLSRHLVEICQELLKLDDSIDRIMGFPDNMKLRSCMTLFYLVSNEMVFKNVLDKFFAGEMDAFTEEKLSVENKPLEAFGRARSELQANGQQPVSVRTNIRLQKLW